MMQTHALTDDRHPATGELNPLIGECYCPLVPFERYMLADDRRAWPMTFPLRLKFEGTVDLARLESAFEAIVARHVILQCRVTRERNSLYWYSLKRESDRTASIVRACRVNDLAQLGRFLSLRDQLPLTWAWQPCSGGGALHVIFHHAATDGVGALQFMGDWLEQYDALVTGRPPQLRQLDLDLLGDRGRCRSRSVVHHNANGDAPQGMAINDIAREFSRFFLRRITPLHVGKHDRKEIGAVDLDSAGGVCQLEFNFDESRRLRAFAEASGVTLNDLAMRDLLLALYRSNRELGRPGSWYRITMPVNLRERRDMRMPAANRIGFAFLDRRLDESTSHELLLSSLRDENSAVRSMGLAGMFLLVLSGAAKVPGGLRALTFPIGTASTAVFSNVGDVVRRFTTKPRCDEGRILAGDMVMTSFAAVPPTRPGTTAAFLLSQYAGRIGLSISCENIRFPAQCALKVLQLWKANLAKNLTNNS